MKKTEKKPAAVIKDFTIKSSSKGMRTKGDVVKNKKLKNSSRQWLTRHINDEFTQASKALGYRARSAFKILEIQERFKLITNNTSVLDLGCAPGGWSEIIVKITKNTVIGIDLLPTENLSGATFLTGDFLDSDIQTQALTLNNNKKFDAILSDIAPNTTGIDNVDHLNIINVIENEVIFIKKNLAENGHFVTKIFQGEGTQEIISELKSMFVTTKLFKPKSSRKESKEIYIICLNFLG
jgi:23S rRNA (uridine2552-2'-O)-methyltransferase